MNRSRVHILVVDDDPTQGAALRDLFDRAGYQVTLCASAVQAATLAQRQEFHALVVDCMLPRMNGVDLVEEIKQVAVTPPLVILYSGIFRDKVFAKDAIDRTGAVAFLTKPLDVLEVLGLVNEAFPADAPGTKAGPAGLPVVYGAAPLVAADLVTLISAEPTLSGVHLPMLYRRLQAARITGELSMVTATGDLKTISFFEGRIFAVRTPDRESIFGGLAVSLGFVSADEVVAATENLERKLMGQKLVESMALSPHAVQLILEEQLALRLSQTIDDGVLTLDWTARAFAPPQFCLGLERFTELARDWSLSKLGADAIRTELLQWSDYEVNLGPGSAPEALGDLLAERAGDDRLTELFGNLIDGNVTLGARRPAPTDYRFLETRLMHLLHAYQTQNYFQVLGIGETAQALEINRAFEELGRHFNPVNLPSDCPPRVLIKATQVFKVIETAHRTIADELERNRYLLLQQNQRAQSRLEHEPALRAAIHQLLNGQAYDAGQTFQALIEKRLEFPDLRAYRLWAGLACDRRFNAITFEQIPPEERHSAPYQMARGLFFRIRGDFTKARDCFHAALVIDPRLSPARAELEKLGVREDARGRGLFDDVQTLLSKVRRSG